MKTDIPFFSCETIQNTPVIGNKSTNIKFIIQNGEEVEQLAFINSGGFRDEDLNSFSEKNGGKVK